MSSQPGRPSAELFANEFISLSLDRVRGILWLTRSSQPFRNVTDVDGCTAALAESVHVDTRYRLAIINDYREAPPRVAPAFEPAFRRLRQETELGFAAKVAVVSSKLGEIKAARLRRETGGDVAICVSLQDALAHVEQVRVRPSLPPTSRPSIYP